MMETINDLLDFHLRSCRTLDEVERIAKDFNVKIKIRGFMTGASFVAETSANGRFASICVICAYNKQTGTVDVLVLPYNIKRDKRTREVSDLTTDMSPEEVGSHGIFHETGLTVPPGKLEPFCTPIEIPDRQRPGEKHMKHCFMSYNSHSGTLLTEWENPFDPEIGRPIWVPFPVLWYSKILNPKHFEMLSSLKEKLSMQSSEAAMALMNLQ